MTEEPFEWWPLYPREEVRAASQARHRAEALAARAHRLDRSRRRDYVERMRAQRAEMATTALATKEIVSE